MSEGKKTNYQKKEVVFGGKKMILYSIDGNTWSTRQEELDEIMHRLEHERTTFGDLKTPLLGQEEGEEDSEITPKAEGDDDAIEVEVEDDQDSDSAAKPAGSKGGKASGKTGAKAPSPSAKAQSKVKKSKDAAVKGSQKPAAKVQAPATANGKTSAAPNSSKARSKVEVVAPKKRAGNLPAKKSPVKSKGRRAA